MTKDNYYKIVYEVTYTNDRLTKQSGLMIATDLLREGEEVVTVDNFIVTTTTKPSKNYIRKTGLLLKRAINETGGKCFGVKYLPGAEEI